MSSPNQAADVASLEPEGALEEPKQSGNDETVTTNDGPKPCINSDADLAKFLASPVKQDFLKLISAMGRSCADPSLDSQSQYDPDQPLAGLSPPLAVFHGALTYMPEWRTKDIPPQDFAQARFGNPAFQSWHARWVARSPHIISTILEVHEEYPPDNEHASATYYPYDVLEACAARGATAAQSELDWATVKDDERVALIKELCAYLHHAFGHEVRLDYGTGHESSLQVFLFVLCKMGCFGSPAPTEPPTKERLKAIALSIYTAYLAVTRQLQTDYMLEPAGSHGVWGLDDYHCLPFYFGACQMQGFGKNDEPESQLGPSAIHDESVLEREAPRLLYFGCIRYIRKLKKGVPFFECSPMLNDISHIPTWSKVAAGLLRLYEGEVLQKRPVVQHFVFGKLFAANWSPSPPPRPPPPGNQSFRTGTAVLPMVATVGNGHLPATRAPWARDPAVVPPQLRPTAARKPPSS